MTTETVSLNYQTEAFFLLRAIIVFIAVAIIAVTIVINIVVRDYQKAKSRKRQQQFLKNYQFSEGLRTKFAKSADYLNTEQQELVFKALKDYFFICYESQRFMASMPSQIVDRASMA